MKCFGCQDKEVVTNKIANKSKEFYFMLGIGHYDLSKINDEFFLYDRMTRAIDEPVSKKRKFIRKLIRGFVHTNVLSRWLYRYFRRREKPQEIENIVTWH